MAVETPPVFEVLRELAVVRHHLSTVTAKRKELADRRLELYRTARERGATLRAIADAAGVSDVAVLRAIQAKDKAEAEAEEKARAETG